MKTQRGRMKKEAVVVLFLAFVAAVLINSSSGATSKCREFQCRDGKCVPWTAYCDRHKDCSDGSDECSCDCTKDKTHKKFQCANKQCLPTREQCDGKRQCSDGTDEIYCKWRTTGTSRSHTHTTTTTATSSSSSSSTLSTSSLSAPLTLSHKHVLMWVIVGAVGGVTVILACLSLLAIYIAVARSVKRYRDGKENPVMLHYDRVPDEETENEEVEGNIYESLLEQPPSYQELEKANKKLDLSSPQKQGKGSY